MDGGSISEAAGPTNPSKAAAGGHALRAALLDSRQRWQDLVALASDLAFETDADGVLVFVTPDVVLGWPAQSLLGRMAEELLVDAEQASPFRPVRRAGRRAWLRRGDGGQASVALVCRPVRDAAGRTEGWRGIGHDVTAQDRGETTVAAALRRAEVLDHILRQMRQEVLAPRMMNTALNALIGALGADGAAVLDPSGDAAVRHQVGEPLGSPGGGHRLLSCAVDTSAGQGASLVCGGLRRVGPGTPRIAILRNRRRRSSG